MSLCLSRVCCSSLNKIAMTKLTKNLLRVEKKAEIFSMSDNVQPITSECGFFILVNNQIHDFCRNCIWSFSVFLLLLQPIAFVVSSNVQWHILRTLHISHLKSQISLKSYNFLRIQTMKKCVRELDNDEAFHLFLIVLILFKMRFFVCNKMINHRNVKIGIHVD